MPVEILVALGAGLVALGFAFYLAFGRVLKASPGNATMVEISGAIYEGAMAFLRREYRAIGIFVLALAVIIALGLKGTTPGLGAKTAIAYVFGALCSTAAGFFGMQIATRANSRTAQAATEGYNRALGVAFPGGAVMGFSVAGIGLAGLSLAFYLFGLVDGLAGAAEIIAGFSMGASSIALFARVGGGIYTKAADVGADLVGKVEAGIPEDDPRNPAVIADNVGDNVGDVAGMGADLFESYVATFVGAVVIALSTIGSGNTSLAVSYAFSVGAVGILASILGIFFVRVKEGGNPQAALRNGTLAAAGLFLIGIAGLSFGLYSDFTWQETGSSKTFGALGLFLSTAFGLIAGMVVGFVAEYYTSGKSVREIAQACKTGAATNIIVGLATGMKSTVLPLIVIGIAVLLSYYLAGFFGIAVAALGMLGITGMTVAVDAYGPIADNAGGIAEMAHMPKEVRKITDSLDAAGNTTAAIAKGFAIGSAALTALALFTAFSQRTGLRPEDFTISNVNVLVGLMVGGVVPFLFAADTMRAVGRAAFSVVEEVRRQFREIPGLMEGTARAEYARCVDITTEAALREMVWPGIMAVFIPLVVGIVFGVETLAGLLAGSLISGLSLALLLANSGGGLGQRQEVHRNRRRSRAGRQRLPGSQGGGGRRHRRRPLEGHLRPLAEYPAQAHGDRVAGLRAAHHDAERKDHIPVLGRIHGEEAMREYESIFVLHPDVSDSQVEVEVEKVREFLASRKGEVTEVQKWGRRKLAYDIDKLREGIYTLIRFTSEPGLPAELDRRYRLNENMIRFLTVLYEKPTAAELAPAGEGQKGDEDDDSEDDR